MTVCKCIVPLWQGDTLNSRRAASPLVWLVEGEERNRRPQKPSSQDDELSSSSPVPGSKLRGPSQKALE
ncbi:hypothetical protein TNCV_2068631 [Trichonephila clavipes]|uniref:Uncharacterized protein n=1 Tax=Trichonephila clavipes TaxID=2585209 RepID=A0A8X7BE83_TRICX|nr:hypothetical protein TNCV_2068631 [Trichonephila clavipes]